MQRFIETLIDGIATGSIYGALALALVLIYRSTGIVNFAQGEFAMFSTFIAWSLTEAGVALGFAILITLVVSLIGGMLVERVLIRPVEGGQELTLVTVPKAGHFVHRDAPELVTRTMLRWLKAD